MWGNESDCWWTKKKAYTPQLYHICQLSSSENYYMFEVPFFTPFMRHEYLHIFVKIYPQKKMEKMVSDFEKRMR